MDSESPNETDHTKDILQSGSNMDGGSSKIEGKPTDQSDGLSYSSAENDVEEVVIIEETESKQKLGMIDRFKNLPKKKRWMIIGGTSMIVLILIIIIAVSAGGNSDDDRSQQESNFDFQDVTLPSEPAEVQTSFPTTASPTLSPTLRITGAPSTIPTTVPSASPTTPVPTAVPSASPTRAPAFPTESPTMAPRTRPEILPVNRTSETLTTLCIIADVPYNDEEAEALPGQISSQMDGCEFLVHLGDIMQNECSTDKYLMVQNMLLESPIPVFIVPGDNEWNDCGNNAMVAAAWNRWEDHFTSFERNWNHTLAVTRNVEYPEMFYILHKRTIFIGLNVVGGRVHDTVEWRKRHDTASKWVEQIAQTFIPSFADGVIVMAHAQITDNHMDFFDPMRRTVRDAFGNEVPFLYLHGDGHSYKYVRGFLNQPNMLGIQHMGGVRNPILKIQADPFALGPEVTSAFQVDRQL